MSDFRALLEDIGAIQNGHFLYSSGMHGEVYVEKFNLLRNPAAASEACTYIADHFRDYEIDVVVGPTTGGIILAFEIARQLGVAAAYAESAGDGSKRREIRRGTTFEPGTRVLVVDDVSTTGGAFYQTLDALKPHPVEIVGIGALVDRSAGEISFGGIPFYAILSRKFDAWEAADCPLCAAGVPLVKPGTTANPGR